MNPVDENDHFNIIPFKMTTLTPLEITHTFYASLINYITILYSTFIFT